MTKADILKHISGKVNNCIIDSFIFFTVEDWGNSASKIIESIKKQFSNTNLIVRSSSIDEDKINSSCAGKYLSLKNIPIDDNELVKAINSVISSYEKNSDFNNNQIIVQKFLSQSKLSGVLFNYDYRNDKPYYFIEYDDTTSLTDTVTTFGSRKSLIISRAIGVSRIRIEEWNHLINVVNQIEEIFPNYILDIEFAFNVNGDLHVFQVRLLKKCIEFELPEISKFQSYANFFKQEFSKHPVVYSNMADWNPVEMLGANCKPLSSSLYLTLIGDKVWKESRKSLGYFEPNSNQLFKTFFNEIFVDVRGSLLSLTPQNIDGAIREKIVNGGITKLINNPYLHDKIEFEIAASTYFINEKKFDERLLEYNLSKKEIEIYRNTSISNTRWILKNYKNIINEGNLALANLNSSVGELKQSINNTKSAKDIYNIILPLISSIKRYGTFEFSKLARLAFIGEQFTNQLKEIEILDDKLIIQFYSSLKTVPKYFTEGVASVKAGTLKKSAFLEDFGHLRINTYDITSPNYNEIFEVLFSDSSITHNTTTINWQFSNNGYKFIDQFTNENILTFAKDTIEARELFKFQFTKAVSFLLDSLKIIASYIEIPLFEFQFLKLSDIIKVNYNNKDSFKNQIDFSLKNNKETYFNYSKVKLPDLISDSNDFYFFKEIVNKPNYITSKTVQANTLYIKSLSNIDPQKLAGRIIIIEAMDPGYDWIFLYPISGIVTKYGGVASHIAIRCKELDLPAVIGCGSLFDKIKNSRKLMIEASNQNIKVIE
jgi:phosphohistidine swiveling domain-containing protein